MESSVADLIQRIQNPDVGIRLAALEELGRRPSSGTGVVRFLGRLAMNDPEPPVRAAALRVLLLPQYQAEQSKMSSLPDDIKHRLLPEIQIWEIDGVITPVQAELLRSRLGGQVRIGAAGQVELPVPPSEAQPETEIAAGVQPPPLPAVFPTAPADRGSAVTTMPPASQPAAPQQGGARPPSLPGEEAAPQARLRCTTLT